MEKQGIVKPGLTPPEKKDGQKQAAKASSQLEDSPAKRLSDGAATAVRQTKS